MEKSDFAARATTASIAAGSTVAALVAATWCARTLAYCRGGVETGGVLGVTTLVLFAALLAATLLFAFAVGRRLRAMGATPVRRAGALLPAILAVPIAGALATAISQANPTSPLSCTRAMLSSGSLPKVIVTVHEGGASFWRPRVDHAPRAAASPEAAFRRACRIGAGDSVFLVTRVRWSPAPKALAACKAELHVLAPAL